MAQTVYVGGWDSSPMKADIDPRQIIDKDKNYIWPGRITLHRSGPVDRKSNHE
uniref:Uncharacterized protein n=1 Tax=Aquisalinus luteolus TaxID=1566827 RepID=A0A8J3ENX3_9PROT|nr:hypothetical protein GCM10011355_01130 [Aquisalinus luteolus]